jgi:hypothetical protein
MRINPILFKELTLKDNLEKRDYQDEATH